MSKDTNTLLMVAGACIGLYLLSRAKTGDDEGSLIPAIDIPGIDLSGLIGGINLPSGEGSSFTMPDFTIPEINIPGLGGVGSWLPSIPSIPSIPEILGIGEGEKDVLTGGEPTDWTWEESVKGFVIEHPLLASSIAIPGTLAASYGFIRAVPVLVKGTSALISGIYNTVKLPVGFNIWKLPKITPSIPSIGAGSGIGGFLGQAGIFSGIVMASAGISDAFARAFGIEDYFGQGIIEFLSPVSMFKPRKASASQSMPTPVTALARGREFGNFYPIPTPVTALARGRTYGNVYPIATPTKTKYTPGGLRIRG